VGTYGLGYQPIAHRLVAHPSLNSAHQFQSAVVVDVMKSHSAVSQGNVTRSKEARCAVVTGAPKARFLRLVEYVVPRSVALAFALRRQRSHVRIVSGAPLRFGQVDQFSSRSRSSRGVPLKRGSQCSGPPVPDISSQVDSCKSLHIHPSMCPASASLGRKHRLGVGLYGAHSMRRTKATQIYRKTGNLRAVQLPLGRATYCPRTTG
jgi:hypothetical protein